MILLCLSVFALTGSTATSPRDEALLWLERVEERLSRVESYSCRIESMIRSMDKTVTEEKVFHYTWVRPGVFKIRVLQGGMGEVFVDPREEKARARLPGPLSLFRVSLDLDDPRFTDVRGFHILESSWFSMIRTWIQRAKEAPEVRVERSGDTLVVETSGLANDPHGEYRARLYLDVSTLLPLGARAWDQEGGLVHEAWFRDIAVNTGLRPEDVRF